ncbi:hypothetical protein E3N86_02940 [Cryobacterium sp. Hz7]|uniref:hypothetical protein n=1 Tax=Cryobacterium sp. Hz7 TaxID=1259166 RepID=UPI00106C529A|nr:hypothetical protein [Cryobacterium sp. Hz7]TFB64604.1 hypothetical protein E3N86_02940 [Cryobacterium sp. Hz7]
MRTVQRDLLVLGPLLLLGTLALTGCTPEPVPQAPQASETTAPTDAPVFASDEEALAAATEAYAAYLAVIDMVLADGGKDTSQLVDVTAEEALRAETDSANLYTDNGYRSVGSTAFDSVQLQSIKDDGRGHTAVTAYLCSDVTRVDVVDSTGASVVPNDRVDRFPLTITFQNSSAASNDLTITSSESWSGKNYC